MRSEPESHDMSVLIVRSIVAPDSSSNLRVPSVGLYPKSRCSCASASKLSFISPKAWPRHGDLVALRGVDRGGDRVEALGGELVAGPEGGDLLVGGLRHEILGSHLHARQGGLNFAARIGEHRRARDALEGVPDLGLAAGEGQAVGQKADDRDHRDGGDAAAHRELRDELLEREIAHYRKRHVWHRPGSGNLPSWWPELVAGQAGAELCAQETAKMLTK